MQAIPKRQIFRLVSLLLVVAAGLLLGDDTSRLFPKEKATPAARQEAAPREASGESRPGSSAVQGPIWTSTRTLTARENAEAHWRKHRREFPEYRSAQEYIEGAHQFLRGPPEETEEKNRPNGDRLLYHPASNTFAVQAKSGAPRTMFRPNNGARYWSRQ